MYDKEKFTEQIRAIIALSLVYTIIGLSAAVIFGVVPKDNQQMANSIIMFLLGVLAGAVGYYFTGNPSSKKQVDNTDSTTVTATVSQTDTKTQ